MSNYNNVPKSELGVIFLERYCYYKGRVETFKLRQFHLNTSVEMNVNMEVNSKNRYTLDRFEFCGMTGDWIRELHEILIRIEEYEAKANGYDILFEEFKYLCLDIEMFELNRSHNFMSQEEIVIRNHVHDLRESRVGRYTRQDKNE